MYVKQTSCHYIFSDNDSIRERNLNTERLKEDTIMQQISLCQTNRSMVAMSVTFIGLVLLAL